MSVTVVGDAFIDIIVPAYRIKEGETYHRKIAMICGGTANVAIWISRLGEKAKFVGKIGNDAFGIYFRQNLKSKGVVDFLFVDAQAPTGLCISLVSESGERTMIADRSANDNLTREEIESCLYEIANSRIVYFSGYSLVSEKTKEATLYAMEICSKKCEIWFNPGAPNIIQNDIKSYVHKFVNVLILNLHEAMRMTNRVEVKDIMKDLSRLVDLGVVTMGKDGCVVFSKGNYIQVPTQKLDVKDTTGAGDAFSAGFIVGKLRGLNEIECAKLGNQTATRFLKEKAKGFE